MDDYDVIVVGAGFGGPVAAKKCAEAGLSTLILERAAAPGEKVISSLTIPFYGFLFGPSWIRDGDPPIERPVSGIRNFFIKDGQTYAKDCSFRVPRPFGPRVSIGYTTYCKPFCTWLSDRAVEAGAELRTSVTAVDVIKENGKVRGVVTDRGEELRSKMLLDSEGLQNLLGIKAGIRKKYLPEVIELCLLLDFEMPKAEVDRVCGYNLEYFWSMPDEEMIAPLGYGSAVYIFPYRESIHMTIGCFLRAEDEVALAVKTLDAYYEKFFQTDRWQSEYAPHAKLRARIWDTCPIYAGLHPETRDMPTFTDNMLLLGDAAGMEAASIADGVPTAWFSAEIAADTTIEALKAGDTSADFLSRYDQRLRAHPLITTLITDPHRRDLKYAAINASEKEMRKRVHNGWGFGMLKHLTWPVTKAVVSSMWRKPGIPFRWMNMFNRYYKLYR